MYGERGRTGGCKINHVQEKKNYGTQQYLLFVLLNLLHVQVHEQKMT